MSDAQRDPYTAALSTFSKIAEKLVFSPVDDDRPEEEVAELLHRSFVTPSTLDVTTSNTEDGEEFEVVTARWVKALHYIGFAKTHLIMRGKK